MKFLFTILCILCSKLSFSQMRVEDIKSNRDVIKFVKKQYKGHGYIVDKIKFYKEDRPSFDTASQNTLAKLKLSTFIREDINGDGHEDLIFCGDINWKPSVVAFISNNSNAYTYLEVSHKSNEDYSKTYLIKSISEKLFLFCTIGEVGEQRLDTIAYTNFSFIPFNSIAHYSIDSVRVNFGSRAGFGAVDIFKDGSFDCYKNCDFVAHDKYHLVIPEDSAKTFLNYVAGLPFYNYVPDPWFYGQTVWYSCNECADGMSWTTRVYFSNGIMIIIDSHMTAVPYGLQYLYAFIYKLFNRSDMKFIKIVKDEDVPQ